MSSPIILGRKKNCRSFSITQFTNAHLAITDYWKSSTYQAHCLCIFIFPWFKICPSNQYTNSHIEPTRTHGLWGYWTHGNKSFTGSFARISTNKHSSLIVRHISIFQIFTKIHISQKGPSDLNMPKLQALQPKSV